MTNMRPYHHHLPLRSKVASPLFRGANIDNRMGIRTILGAGGGGLLGAGLGGGVGLMYESLFGDPDNTRLLKRLFQGATIGGLTGTGLGALLGSTNIAKNLHYQFDDAVEEASLAAKESLKDAIRDTRLSVAGIPVRLVSDSKREPNEKYVPRPDWEE